MPVDSTHQRRRGRWIPSPPTSPPHNDFMQSVALLLDFYLQNLIMPSVGQLTSTQNAQRTPVLKKLGSMSASENHIQNYNAITS